MREINETTEGTEKIKISVKTGRRIKTLLEVLAALIFLGLIVLLAVKSAAVIVCENTGLSLDVEKFKCYDIDKKNAAILADDPFSIPLEVPGWDP